MLNSKVVLYQFQHPSSKTRTLIILTVINHFVAARTVTKFSTVKETAMSPTELPAVLIFSCNTIYLTTLQHESSKVNGPWLVVLKLTQNSWCCVIGRVTTKYENRGCARIESAVTFGVRFPTYMLPSYELVWLRADLCRCFPSWSKEPKYPDRPEDTLTSRTVSGREKFLIATVYWLASYPKRPPQYLVRALHSIILELAYLTWPKTNFIFLTWSFIDPLIWIIEIFYVTQNFPVRLDRLHSVVSLISKPCDSGGRASAHRATTAQPEHSGSPVRLGGCALMFLISGVKNSGRRCLKTWAWRRVWAQLSTHCTNNPTTRVLVRI